MSEIRAANSPQPSRYNRGDSRVAGSEVSATLAPKSTLCPPNPNSLLLLH